MSARTWLMMLVFLGLNWGGFIGLLVYGALKADRTDRDDGA